MWTTGTLIEEQEESRGDNVNGQQIIPADLLADVSILLNRLAVKSAHLIQNVTTNLAENWMSVRCKFDDGKMYNRCNRGSWHGRC